MPLHAIGQTSTKLPSSHVSDRSIAQNPAVQTNVLFAIAARKFQRAEKALLCCWSVMRCVVQSVGYKRRFHTILAAVNFEVFIGARASGVQPSEVLT